MSVWALETNHDLEAQCEVIETFEWCNKTCLPVFHFDKNSIHSFLSFLVLNDEASTVNQLNPDASPCS